MTLEHGVFVALATLEQLRVTEQLLVAEGTPLLLGARGVEYQGIYNL